MLSALFISLCIIATGAQAQSLSKDSYSSTTIPDSLKENANSVVRYFSREILIKSAGKMVIKEHSVQTILNSKDEQAAIFPLFYERKHSGINSAEMLIYDKDGVLIKRYKKNDFYDRSAIDDNTIISDDRVMVVGHTIVNFPVTVEKISEVSSNSFLNLPTWQVQADNISIEKAVCKITAKPELGLRYKLNNCNYHPEKKTESEYEVLHFELKNLKAINPELKSLHWTYLPSISFAINSTVFFGQEVDMSSWKGFGLWANQLNQDVTELSAKRVEEIKQMTLGISSEKAKAKFLYEYLQKNTRYVSIQLGIGGFKPFQAAFVDEKKYGDCKALSNYMRSLLKSVGIESHYAIVRAGDNEPAADPKFVSSPFNHVIICIPFKNDTTWLECTSSTKSFGKLGTFTENRNAVLVSQDGGKLVSTPKSVIDDHLFESNVVVTISSDGSAKAKTNLRSTGEYRDMFLHLSDLKIDERKEFLIDQLNFKQPDVFQLYEPVDKEGTNELVFDLEYTNLSDIRAETKFILKPRIHDIWQMSAPAITKRKTDFYFDHPMLKKCKTTFKLPTEFEVESLPSNVTCKFSYGSYTANYTYDKTSNEVTSTAQFAINNHVIPASKYNEMQTFLEDVTKSMSKKLVIRKKI